MSHLHLVQFADTFRRHLETFSPRDAIHKRGLCCRPVFVRPSVALVDCIQTAEDIVKFLGRPDSPIILVF